MYLNAMPPTGGSAGDPLRDATPSRPPTAKYCCSIDSVGTRPPGRPPVMHSETPLTHSETKQKHVTITKSDLSSSAKRRAGLDAMESHVPACRITTPRPQSASTTSRLSTRRVARENPCLAPAAYRRRSRTNVTEARGVPDASKTAPRRRRNPWPRCASGTEVSQKQNAATQHPTQHILLGTRDTSPTVESPKAPTRRLETRRPTTTLTDMRRLL